MTEQPNFDGLIPNRRRARRALLRRFPGLLYDVARLEGKSRAHVTNVFHRNCSSQLVRAAIVEQLLSRMAGTPRPVFASKRRAA